MPRPRKPRGQQQDDPTDAALSLEALGEELLREARAGQAAFVAGGQEFMQQAGIQGQAISARQLREMLTQQGFNPENNEFSRGIIAMRAG